MAEETVRVGIWHGEDIYMTKTSDTKIMSENVPKVARLLMDHLYLRLDDQVSMTKLRAHRRDLRDKRRERGVGQIHTTQEEEGGREITQYAHSGGELKPSPPGV